MDNDSSNPFDRFLKSTSLDMLEAALPYVGPGARKPLALYMKSMEIDRILQDLDDSSVLSACGFENRPADPEAMLRAMKAASAGKPTPQLDQLLNMLNMLKTYQSVNEMLQKNPEMANLLKNMMNQPPSQTAPSDLLRQTVAKEPEPNQMMSLLAELLKSADFPH